MQIDYKVNKTFAQVHNDQNPFIFVMGPMGSGKSSGCIWQAVFNAMRQIPQADGVRRSKHAVIRATYPALRTTTIPSWVSWFKDKIRIIQSIPMMGYLKFDLPDGTKVDMEIVFIAVDDEASIQKLRSLELTSAHINEANEVAEPVLEMLKGRINRYPAEKDGGPVNSFIILDYNGVSTTHWLYRLAEEDKPEGYSFYKQPPAVLMTEDGKFVVNPEADNLEHLNVNYYPYQLQGADEDFVRVNLMNNYGEQRSGRPVFKDYDDRRHCFEKEFKPLRGVPVVIGVDQGLTPAAVFTQQAPNGQILVFDEITTEDCSLQEFCEDLLWPLIRTKYPEIVGNFHLVCDPAAAQRSMNDAKAGVDVLREFGFKVKLAKTNVFAKRREAVVYFLRMHNKFVMSPECQMLRKGFLSGYKYDEVKSALRGDSYLKDKPSKNEFSHVHDALQYALLEFHNVKPKKEFTASRKKYQVASSIGGY